MNEWLDLLTDPNLSVGADHRGTFRVLVRRGSLARTLFAVRKGRVPMAPEILLSGRPWTGLISQSFWRLAGGVLAFAHYLASLPFRCSSM